MKNETKSYFRCNLPTKISIFCLIFAFGVTVLHGADVIDLSFNSGLETTTQLSKSVKIIIPLPDGKFLAAGGFNKYNGQPVGGLIRVNSNGTLDGTFNNNLLAPNSSPNLIRRLPDGSFLLLGEFRLDDGTSIFRIPFKITPDGNRDTSFTFSTPGSVYDDFRIDQSGRVIVPGFFQVVVNGNTVNRTVLRLNPDGSPDLTLVATEFVSLISTQGDKIIYITDDLGAQQQRMFRFNTDGSVDSGFNSTLLGNRNILDVQTQPDGKILVLSSLRLFRVNADGGIDTTFTETVFSGAPTKIALHSDGTIITAFQSGSPTVYKYRRYLPSGVQDPSFTEYISSPNQPTGFGIAASGSVYIGDANSNGANEFVRLFSDGTVDPTHNPGGTGYQSVNPGRIRVIKEVTGGKLLIGGDFDKVGAIQRFKLARLNPDSSLDTTFALPMGTGDNQFSALIDIYGITLLGNGKMIVNGGFTYRLDGATKQNIVRLNSDGTIDSTFNLAVHFNDTFASSAQSQNHTAISLSSGVIVAPTRSSNQSTVKVPTGLTSGGAPDTGFNASVFSTKNVVNAYSIAALPDGKLLMGGRHEVGDVTGSVRKSFLVRLNSDGSLDSTFTVAETNEEEVYAFSVLANGKIIVVRRAINGSYGKVYRLTANGDVDPTFSTGTGANGKINAIKPFTEGRILVGGVFTSFDAQSRSNFAILNENGSLNPLDVSLNREVLAIEVDNQNRILIGGGFTTIQSGAQLVQRTYLVRLNDLTVSRNTIMDFDGDGKSDISVFRPSVGEWYYRSSSTGSTAGFQFGSQTDQPAPADFTGDGKTDIAFYRKSTGTWFVLRSEDSSFFTIRFGIEEDIPAPGDFDGDGLDDAAVFRPSTGEWFANLSGGGTLTYRFGVAGDKPVVSDYDGDGKDDIAIYRPSLGQWWLNRSTAGVIAYTFGNATDIPVFGDYTGDGKSDVAVWRPSTGQWLVLRSEDASFFGAPFGLTGDIPTPGDYDGDGKFDFAVFRPGSTYWFIQKSNGGFDSIGFGLPSDLPLPSYYQR